MEKVVDIKRVTKKFGDFKALDEVDFPFERGRSLALLVQMGPVSRRRFVFY